MKGLKDERHSNAKKKSSKAEERRKFTNRQALVHFSHVTLARAAELRFMGLYDAAQKLIDLAARIIE
jgi:hypothetical protein